MVNNGNYLTAPQLAEILGISRIAVFKRIKKGRIPAERVGRNYMIPVDQIRDLLGDETSKELSENEKAEITQTVKRVVNEYGETLRLLGKE